MSIYRILGILSAIVFAIAYIPYIVSIGKGRTKPHPFSWLLWSLIGVISAYFYVRVGAVETLPFAFAGAVLPFIVAVISFRNWEGGFSNFDYLCLALSASAIIAYILFHSAAISLTLSLCADSIAFLPTMRKTFFSPSSESIGSWGLFLLSYALSLLAAIPRFSYGVVIFPAYLTFCGIVMCLLILRGRLKKAR